MSFNKDELEPPKWMDNVFFTEVLNVCKKGIFLKIINHEITPATLKGDHFASIMFRGKVKYLNNDNMENEISLIIKIMPDDGFKKDLLADSKIFETEIRMYRDVIPKLEEILREAGDNTVLGAKMLYWSLNPRKIVIFEDITEYGFRTIGQRLASLEETKLALEKLAKWHAVSVVYNQKSGGALESFVDGVYNLPNLETNEFFNNGTAEVIKLVKTFSGFEEYIPKLEKINKKILKRCMNVYNVNKSSSLNVLNHGDFHSKNLMFTYPKGKVGDVMLVDFQICVWSSMALDLIYVTYMLTDMQTRLQHMEELRYWFFNIFIETLKKIGYKGKLPVYTDLQIEFIKFHFIELFLVFTFLPFMHAITKVEGEFKDMEPTEMFENNNWRTQIYNQQSYVDELKMQLPIFLYKGYLDGYDED